MILIRSTRNVFVALLLLGLFVMAASHVTDPDFWWHLRTGQLIVETRQVPHTDPYSFTRSGQPWIAHEWLSEVMIYGIYRAAGWSGLIIFFALVIAAAQLLIYARCSARPYGAALLTLWGTFTSAPAWGARPQMLSLLLGSIFLFLLEHSRRSLLWWTVPLMVVWVNLHAGYVLGVAFIAFFLLGELLDVAFGFESWPQSRPRLRSLSLTLFACLLVVPMNPNGARLYWYPFATLASPSMQRNIVEWASPNFHQAAYFPLLLLLLGILAGIAVSRHSLRPREILLLLFTAAAALQSVRHIPIFCLVAIPILSHSVRHLLESRFLPKEHPVIRTPGKLALNTALLAGLAIFTIVRVTFVIRTQSRAVAEKYPVAATTFLTAHPPNGALLNAYEWGGYLIWKLYPGVRVFVDGRADVYGDAFLDEYRKTYGVGDDWKAALDRWQIKTVIVPQGTPLAMALRPDHGWMPIYQDSQALVLELSTTSGAVPTSQLRPFALKQN